MDRCETLSFFLRAGKRVRMFGNKVLRGKYGPKWEKIPGAWIE
jgi:hypothetical protein